MATVHDLEYTIIFWKDDSQIAIVTANFLIRDLKTVLKYFLGYDFNYQTHTSSLKFYTKYSIIYKGNTIRSMLLN